METDRTRPLLLGYIRRQLAGSEEELARAIDQLASFASMEGFALGAIFVDRMDLSLAAFAALVDAVNRDEVTTVAVPTMLHFAILAPPRGLKSEFEYLTGLRSWRQSRQHHEPAGGRTGAL